ncbi:FtsX-like permease family protein [Actinoplanes sp. KI2]|uniref:FtsX-like permease family protein n=1 Tax=Actinoplanes sp. KI2 TaxID=2983315 RepID=UPI0021D5BDDE|nr:FtsX-like permease family protein [Actinoplanes sp. KI2]MCU7724551.1 FtsX-like permease family protein [Actinoplanes sp. KI2]
MAARRAVVRWAWRLFRREWRQQALVLALLTLAVTATVFGLGAVANAPASPAAVFGNADYRVGLPGSTSDLAALRASYPAAEIIEHRKVTVRGLATALDVRGQAPDGPLGKPKLRLTDGRYPSGPGEVALTARVARLLGLHVGSAWRPSGTSWTVVGLVENPLDLLDTFALVQPGLPGPVDRVEILVKATGAQFAAVHRPDGSTVDFRGAGDVNAGPQAVLILATVGLLFVGLLAAAGFTVLAQRRQRALGMLGAVGARQRHLRLVTQANGALVGAVAAVVGGGLGLLIWFAAATRLEGLVEHRIDRFDVPWTEVVIALLLAFLTAVLAAWWPARGVARVPIVAALSDRPPRPRPAHRFAVAGVVLTAAGLALLVASKHSRPFLIVGGILATAVGMLLLAPLGVAALAAVARICPVGPRLALRDLARYRARSGAALAAISLGTGIAAAVVIGAGAAQAAGEAPPTTGNLPPDQLIVWLSPERISGPVPTLSAEDLRNTQAGVQSVADGLHARWTLPLVGALSPKAQPMGGASGVDGKPVAVLGIPEPGDGGHTRYNGDTMIPLLVATPALLQRYGIDPASIDPAAEVLTARTDLSRYDLLTGAERPHKWQPAVQRVTLPVYTSEPIVLLTDHGMRSLGLDPITVGWLIQAPAALTPAQVDKATTTAIATGLSVETRPVLADMARLRAIATGIGVAVALGVLAMTVGLIRGEGARDLRTLTANGAGGGTRRILVAATAAALGGLGALLGVTGAYAAQIAWYVHQLHWLAEVPLMNLAGLVVGLPLVAAVGGWLLGGRAPSAIARTPL